MNLPQKPGWASAIIVSIPVLILATAVRWVGVGQEPLNDELFHYLAAKAWLERGDMAILPGAEPYDRAKLYTLLTAFFMKVFGTSLEIARIPSVAAGSMLAAGVTFWLARKRMALAGTIAGVLVALDPLLIQLSQISRFYAVQGLAIFVGAVAILTFVVRNGPVTKTIAGSIALFCLLFAFHLQVITLIPLTALLLFAVSWPESDVRKGFEKSFRSKPLLSSTALAATLILATAVLWTTGLLARLIGLATYSDAWAEGSRDNLRFYYAFLHDGYAPLVVLFPLLGLLAWNRDRRTAALSLFIFGFGFVLQSLVAWKSPRYFSYTLPFFFAVSAIGLVEAGKYVVSALPELIRKAGVHAKLRRTAVIGTMAFVIVSLVVGSRSLLITSRLLTREPQMHYPLIPPGESLSWSRAKPALDSVLDGSRLLVSSNHGKAVFFFDRLSYILEGRRSAEREFHIDARFDRPVVSAPESLTAIRCLGEVILVAERHVLARPEFPPSTRGYIAREGAEITLPPGTGLYAAKLARLPASTCASVKEGWDSSFQETTARQVPAGDMASAAPRSRVR